MSIESASRELRGIADTISALALFEAARHESGRERVDRGVVPPQTLGALADLDGLERARLASAINGHTREGLARSAIWWRRAIDRVRGEDQPDPQEPSAEPADALTAMATLSLYLELSVHAINARTGSPHDSAVDKAIAALPKAQRIMLAQRLARNHVVWPAGRDESWWLSQIAAVRKCAVGIAGESPTPDDIGALNRMLGIACM